MTDQPVFQEASASTESTPAPEPAPALWGTTKDGKPRRKPGPRPGAHSSRAAAARGPSVKKPAPAKGRGRDYRTGVTGTLQLVGGMLAMAGRQNPPFLADAAAIIVHAEPIADACQATAEENPQFAMALERLAAVGPWGALLTAVAGLGSQLARNHGLLPPAMAQATGAIDPGDLVGHVFGSAAPNTSQAATVPAPRRPADSGL